ncbi:Spx/MgsR family RNA polymerase-binding regulatory protein [Suipraeoptans intestinalis]|uniref:Spx/MgsR family RNA polymerase-binding regulatory protein n=1 Tax=Suipraeoptans intestinalis TaxID=2606628 RepID=A0A6N7V1A1_9FIRM|nr:Spx/MgsR family RNA polymerase-binding regulatory protein [Suipraeoptans intestinalis]MDD7770162.1 Spx/MgsR family RNA polymerase-binding regulatory protein [Suipraeoptans intestinalis]MDY3122313.1 Spx/MgsR family RNA polymerase-binding regulatory protein [Suipraeoptans intestinalis]MSR93072.1 Spx/MgsR family RNA polymerase-binding regulatory protein [Suipraeoptans intestinalis]
MSLLFIHYPKCTTCKKAKKWLEDRGIAFEERDIKLDRPTREEIEQWHKKSGLPLKRFFNTSGNLYKELQLKDKLPSMSEEEQYDLLATDGMLVKRPVIVGDAGIRTGFKEKEWLEMGL